MERVAFLIDRSGVRVSCLLNPDSIVLQRLAGVRNRQVGHRPLTGANLRDDPLIYTRGGATFLELEMLFDISLTGSSLQVEDVRDLTTPLWELSENNSDDGHTSRPPVVHFVWGKNWSIPGVVVAVAERLEHFTAEGRPRRSWLRMRMRRVNEPSMEQTEITDVPSALDWTPPPAELLPLDEMNFHEVIGGGEESEDEASGQRLDELAYAHFGDSAYWRVLARLNNIADPLNVAAGTVLQVPRASLWEGRP